MFKIVDTHALSSKKHWETRTVGVGTGTPPPYTRYTNQSFPIASLQPRLINYYDDHKFEDASTAGLGLSGSNYGDWHKTLLTGSKVYKEDGTAALLHIYYYDKRGRLIQSVAQNHLGGTDRISNIYNFPGELKSSTHVHIASGQTTTTLTKYEYDHMGRPVETRHKINAQGEVILSKNEYNEIGQLKEKKLHSENGGTSFHSSSKYTYNERGWLARQSSAHFTQELYYHKPLAGGTPQYNGNISQQRWGHASTVSETTNYGYDKLNRLLSGIKTGTVMSEVMTYDDMGNITKLTRDGGAAINYTYSGNKLTTLSGGGLSGTYIYDVNGNATKDRTGMTFSYNYLNLPKTAAKTGSSVSYLYDAMGQKLRKTATVGSVTTVRDYIGGIEYQKTGSAASAIEMIHTDEGYLQRNSSNVYTYHYNLKDHLGNVRATLQRSSATAGTVIQKHDYYPFGKAKALVTSGINKYLYNGKELQGELGGQYDYGARFYDAEIGRWNVVDPLAEGRPEMTPYHFVSNNPINRVDPDGRWDDWVQREDGSIYWDKNATSQATTKAGETYLGKNLSFTFNSYIGDNYDGPLGRLPEGNKLTTTIKLSATENSVGELTGLSATKTTDIGKTFGLSFLKGRDYYPGEGGSNNYFTKSGMSINYEQHASVPGVEERGLKSMGYKIVDVAQKLNISFDKGSGNLSVNAYTNSFHQQL